MILYKNQKGYFSVQVTSRVKGIFAYTKNKKGTQQKITSNVLAAFFSKQTCLKNE